jgi:hypothetical protein
MADAQEPRRGRQRSLFQLIADVPDLVKELVRREFDLLKAELAAKLKLIGVGAGMMAIAAVLLLLFVGVLLTAAILALSLVMPGWLAALLVGLVLLIIIAVLVFIGYRSIKQAMPPTPTETIDSVKRDYFALRGIIARQGKPNTTKGATRL